MIFSLSDTNKNTHVNVIEKDHPTRRGIRLFEVKITYDEPQIPELLTLFFSIPDIDIYSVFSASSLYDRRIRPSWSQNVTASRLASGAPVHQLISSHGMNRLLISISDAKTPCSIKTGIRERTAEVNCSVNFFTEPVNTLKEYTATVYLDFNDRPYYESLRELDGYWSDECGYKCAYVPYAAKKPLYSCWYSFHQDIDVEEIVNQCRLAKQMGMETVIVDDGWQCDGRSDAYQLCGDWEPAASKVPDMADFVDRVHKEGLKFMLWYHVPALGVKSKNYEKYKDMLLDPSAASWGALDPRFPEVREFLINTYTDAVKKWGLDGVKLDFIDSFRLHTETRSFDARWDTLSLEDGVDRLLKGVTDSLRALNPDILIEFRQNYFGPAIRKYGNMIRVSDCPNDSIQNHVGGIDLRYMLGDSAVHSDMLMWNTEDTLEAAAYQVICTLYTVPQISVLLDKIPESHRDMLRFYLKFWNEHRDTLLGRKLIADNPEQLYSLVRAYNGEEIVATAFSKPLLDLSDEKEIWFINASDSDLLIFNVKNAVSYRFEIFTPDGKTISEGETEAKTGLLSFNVPRTGMIHLHR